MAGSDDRSERRLRIFLSSPGDLGPERLRAEQVVRALDGGQAAAGGARLELIRWEEGWYSAAGHFQEQLPAPADCDLVLCLFWKRLGTVLPAAYARADGSLRTGTEWEFEVAFEAARQHGRPDILVYRKTAPVVFEAASLELEVAQKRALDGFWSRWFRSEEGQLLAAFKEFADGDAFARLLDGDLRAWLAGRRGVTWPIALRGSPFPGLSAYDETRSEVFFGRRRAVEQARARLVGAVGPADEGGLPILLILGMSGAGKSSLLRAGLLPRLRQPGATPRIARWRRLVVTPAGLGPQPLEGLAAALLRPDVLPELGAGDFGDPGALAALWTAAPETGARPLLAALDRWAGRLAAEEGHGAPPATGLLLALDQLEEAFTWPEGQRAHLVRLLRALAQSGRVWLLATLRSDAYPLLQADAGLLALKEAGRTFDLTPPAAAEVREIVEAPAAAAGLGYERDPATGESLAERLEAEAGGVNALPLLQFALAELYEGRDPESGLLRWASYRAMGGLPGAVEMRAEAALRALPPAEQQALPALLFALATVKEGAAGEALVTAETLPLAQLAPGTAVRALADALVAARLLNAEGDGAGARLRVAHEALFTHWGRARDLLAASRADLALTAALRRQARAWVHDGKPAEDLLRGGRLPQAEDLLRRRGAELGEASELRAYVAASAAARRVGERRRRRRLVAAFAVLAILLAAALGFALYAQRQEQAADRQRQAAERSLGVAVDSVETLVSTTSEELGSILGVTQARLLELLRRAEAGLALLSQDGAATPALDQARAKALLAFADAYYASGDLAAALERAVEAGALVRGLSDPEARRLLSSSLNKLGDAQLDQGDLEAATRSYEESLALARALVAERPDDLALRRALEVALERIGDARAAAGDLPGALAAHEESQALTRSLAEAEPDNPTWQRHLAIGLDRLGDAQQSLGRLEAAEASYREGLALRRALAAADPRNAATQRELTIGLENLDSLLMAKGDLAGAAAALEESLRIRRALVAGDAGNSGWRRDLAASLLKQGDLKLQQGNLAGGRSAYEEGLGLLSQLVQQDAGNAGWQGDLAVALNKLGGVKATAGDAAGALALYREALELRRRLVGQAPGNANRQRDLAASLDQVGDALLAMGDLASAAAPFEESLALRRALVARSPTNSGWLRDLTASLDRVGDVKLRQGDLAAAEAAYDESLAIMRDLAAKDPANLGWQRDLSISLERVGDLAMAKKDPAAAIAAYQESVAIRRTLAAADPANLGWQRDLALGLNKLGGAQGQAGNATAALATLDESIAVLRRLIEQDAGNTQWQLDLVVALVQAAAVAPAPLPLLEEALAILERLDGAGALPSAIQPWVGLLRGQLESLR